MNLAVDQQWKNIAYSMFSHIGENGMSYIYKTLVLFLISFSVVAQPPRLIGFLGQKRVGKDSCADYLVQTYGFQKYAMATPMKDAIKIIFNFSDDQVNGDAKEIVDPRWGVTPRQLMNFLGVDTLKIRLPKLYPQVGDIYTKHLEIILKENLKTSFTISDLRFQKDVDAIKKNGGIIIKVTRPGLNNHDQHISEQGVDKIKRIDYYIVNDGNLEDLHKKLENILAKIDSNEG
jgi:hypothetical protein